MVELKESVKVSSDTKNQLIDIKTKEEHSSIDSVIKTLLLESEAYRLLKEELRKQESK